MVKHKNALYAKFVKTKDLNILAEFKSYRNKLTSTLRKAKDSYLIDMFDAETTLRPDAAWRKLNSLVRPGTPTLTLGTFRHGEKELSGVPLADAFNHFFIQQTKDNELDGSSIRNYAQYVRGNDRISSLFLAPTETAEVFSSINNLKNSKTLDVNGFQILPLKYVLDKMCPIITYIYNLILSTGVFPTGMQIARVIPIFKKGDKNLFTNYRPISILPVFSKGIEKIIHHRVTSYFDENHLFLDFQHGLRKKRSTGTALLTQKEIIIKAFSENKLTMGIYIDFTKAFDLINHDILFKLERYGVRGLALTLLQSYLSHRTQYVDINTASSPTLHITCGVPQGSNLGPLLFLVYINDIVYSASNVQVVSFADDTTFFVTGISEAEVESKTSEALNKLHSWADANSLRINPSKTQILLYLPKGKKISRPLKIALNSQPIELVTSVKTLGVIFSHNLTWNAHIEHICSKVSSALGILGRFRHIFPVRVKMLLYNALVLSHIQYCSLVWGTTGVTSLHDCICCRKKPSGP